MTLTGSGPAVGSREIHSAAIVIDGTCPVDCWRHASGLPNLTERLLQRGFGAQDVRGILGENWLRVFGEVWSAPEHSRRNARQEM